MTTRIDTIDGLRAALRSLESSAAPRGLVPTMGALHAGHARLIERARAECAPVVVSIFVNPLQFDRPDDLARYPRDLDRDLAMCRELGVDLVFAPAPAEIYPRPLDCRVEIGRLGDHLCGPFRPGHFSAVATVVLKLFEIAGPDRAYFGEKDAQQLAIIRRMADDFNLPVDVVEVATVREADGLAMSSRNARLSAGERRLAPALYQALLAAREAIEAGGTDPAAVRGAAIAVLPASDRLRLEYFEIVDPGDLQPVAAIGGPVRAAAAAWVGSTRLIDNLLCRPPRVETS